MHRDGYGFVIPNAGQRSTFEGDIYISPQAIGSAMHGDQVLVELGRRKDDGRAEGKILRVLTRANPTVVGTFHYGSRHNYVTPIDEKVTKEIIIPRGMEWPSAERPDPDSAAGAEAAPNPRLRRSDEARSRSRLRQGSASPGVGRSRRTGGRCRDHDVALTGGQSQGTRGRDSRLRRRLRRRCRDRHSQTPPAASVSGRSAAGGRAV